LDFGKKYRRPDFHVQSLGLRLLDPVLELRLAYERLEQIDLRLVIERAIF
jgi:hypothetical protein